MSTREGDDDTVRWRVTPAFLCTLLVAALCALAAVTLQRPDLLVLGAPFIIITAWSLATRPRHDPVISADIRRTTMREGDGNSWDVSVTHADGADHAIAVMGQPTFVATDPPIGTNLVRIHDGAAQPNVAWKSLRWGRRTVGAGTVTVVSPWGAYRFGPVRLSGRTTRTSPQAEHFALSGAAPHPQGLVGLNRSRQPGEGAEFADIRPFQRGDRLRRIHWPVSARTGELHVRTSYAEQDTEVLVLVDGILDVGVSDGVDGRQSSLDLGVRAASALADQLLSRGERVGLHVFGMRQPVRVPSGMGRRHHRRIIDSLAAVQPTPGIAGSRGLFARVHTGPGSLVLMLSPLVTRDAAEQAAHLVRRGLTVIVVDCLPTDVEVIGADDPLTATAWRIRRLERELEVSRLQHLGIPVVPWRGPGSLDLVLRQLARRAAPRVVSR